MSLCFKDCQAFLTQPLCFLETFLKQCDTSKAIQCVGKQFLQAKPSHYAMGFIESSVRRLILLLDGTRDRQALLRDFRLEVAAAGRPIDGITEERLDAALQRAADMALLVS